jgi:hypothetical protein
MLLLQMQAFRDWGELLQTFHESKTAENAERDFTCTYLGYWTDNGTFP